MPTIVKSDSIHTTLNTYINVFEHIDSDFYSQYALIKKCDFFECVRVRICNLYIYMYIYLGIGTIRKKIPSFNRHQCKKLCIIQRRRACSARTIIETILYTNSNVYMMRGVTSANTINIFIYIMGSKCECVCVCNNTFCDQI